MKDWEEDNKPKIPKVNYAKSIAKGRLVYDRRSWSFNEIAEKVFFSFSITGLTYGGIEATINGEEAGPIFLVLSFAFCLWVISGVVLTNKLVKVIGKEQIQNKEDTINILKEFYDDLTFDESTDNILRDYRPRTFTKAGRVITILFDGKNVYFHKMALGRGDTLTSFFGPTDYHKAREIADRFQEKQSETTSTENLPA